MRLQTRRLVHIVEAHVEDADGVVAIAQRPLVIDPIDDEIFSLPPEIDQALVALRVDDIDRGRLARRIEAEEGFYAIIEDDERLVGGGTLVAIGRVHILRPEVAEIGLRGAFARLGHHGGVVAFLIGIAEDDRIDLLRDGPELALQDEDVGALVGEHVEIGVGFLFNRLYEKDVALLVGLDAPGQRVAGAERFDPLVLGEGDHGRGAGTCPRL